MDTQVKSSMQDALLRGMSQHLNYLARVEQTLAGNDQFAGTKHTECALGRMMLERQNLVLESCPPELVALWQEIDDLHEKFHAASEVALASRQQDSVLEMELLSFKIINHLSQFEHNFQFCFKDVT